MKINSFLYDVMGAFRVTKLRKASIENAKEDLVCHDPINQVSKALHPGKFDVEVAEIRNASLHAKTFVLKSKTGHLPLFKAGQFLTLEMRIGDSLVTRPYSISSAPYQTRGDNPIVEITVGYSKGQGFVSDYLCSEVKVGDCFVCEMPLGGFCYEPLRDSKNIVGLIGGSAVTPFISMAKEVRNGTLDLNLTLLYGSVLEEDILLRDELEACECDKVKVIHVLSGENPSWAGEKGFLTAELIEKYSPKEDVTYFISGPQAMYAFVLNELNKLNVNPRRIRTEVFGQINDVGNVPGYPKEKLEETYHITVRRGVREDIIEAKAKESIGIALERAGIKIHMGCRSGNCGFCRIKVLDGDYFVLPKNDGRRATDKEYHYVHACATFPLSDMTVKVDIDKNDSVSNDEVGYYKKSYDAVIVSGALAGMAAAMHLSEAGVKNILVLEQHNLPGGCATSFVRAGTEIEASLHEMCSVSSEKYPLSVRRYLESHGVFVNWLRVDEAFHYVEPGLDVHVHAGEGGNFEVPAHDIANAVGDPDGSLYKKLMEFFDDVHKVYKSIAETSKKMPSIPTLLKKHIEMSRSAGYSTEEVIDSYHFPEQVKHILEAYWVYLGAVPSELPFVIYAFILADYVGYGPYIPEHTSYEMSIKLAEACMKKGIQMEFNQRVDKILLKDKHVCGVKLANGIVINTPYVISGAYPNTVIHHMIDDLKYVPSENKRWLNSRKLGMSCFSTILILDNDAEKLGLDSYATFYAPKGMDVKLIDDSFHSAGPYEYITSVCINVANPSSSKKGTCVYSITALPYPDGWEGVTEDNYEEWKTRIAGEMIETESQRLGIDLRSHIKEIIIETPITIAHYTGAYQGQIYGYRPGKIDSVVARIAMHSKELYIPGLAYAGAHQKAGDGMAPAFNNGIYGAEDVLTMMKKDKYL